jgi:hypothetical protein
VIRRRAGAFRRALPYLASQGRTMNFFERQEAARKTSRRLLVLFALAVIAIVATVCAAVLLALGVAAPSDTLQAQGFVAFAQERSGALGLAGFATLATVAIASLTRISSLRAGGDAVARQLGGTPVPEETRDPQLRRLRNVVEEIAIASGVPVPEASTCWNTKPASTPSPPAIRPAMRRSR